MAQLMSSGGKGINNPLAKLSNQFSTDRGAQGVSLLHALSHPPSRRRSMIADRGDSFQDLYPNARAGPSRQVSRVGLYRTPLDPSS